MSFKRVMAIIALIAIAVIIALMLLFAFIGAPREWLLACMFMLIVVPVVIYVFIWLTNMLRK